MKVSLAAQHLVKRYGAVVALADGSLEVRSAEVLALLGANGSGKSTLSKIITGVVAPDGGALLLDGRPVSFGSPQAARAEGIAAVYQDLSLIPDMTISENIWLTHEPLGLGWRVRRREARARTAALLELFAGTVQSSFHPDAPISSLPPDERQIVEILKALSFQPRFLILDEATASLDSRQVSRLFDLVAQWKAEGMGIIFISHRMEEIFRLADRATVLRNGSTVATTEIAGTDETALVQLMIEGGMLSQQRPAPRNGDAAPVRLSVAGLSSRLLDSISLELREGELLGLGGLQGQGQADLLLALFGAVPYQGRVALGGQPLQLRSPRQAMRAGLAFVPGDRTSEGLLSIRSILENLQLPSWRRYGAVLRLGQARDDAMRVAQQLKLKMDALDAPVSSLSGGNAQKVVLGKWLLRKPQVLLLNDPTKGIDVGAKGDFYALLADLRASGISILLYSSDDEELLGLCDRVLVMHDGRISAELSGETLTRSHLVAASMGAAHGGAA